MQGTVSAYDDETGAGAVLLDDGREVPFDADATTGTGLRFLRPGQRVRLQMSVAQDGHRIDRLQILTLR